MTHRSALFEHAFQAHRAGRLREAINLYEKILSTRENNAQLLYLLGTANLQLGKCEEAIRHLRRSLAINPRNADALNSLGLALKELHRLDDALKSYDSLLAIEPGYVEAYNNRGIVLQNLNRPEQALASFDQALTIKPAYPEAHNNRGTALQGLKRLDEALSSYDEAIAINPDYFLAHYNRGNVLKELNRLADALASFDKTLAIKPDHAAAHNNRAIVLRELNRLGEALASCEKALAIKPAYAEAHNNRGVALQELKRFDEALASFDKALAIAPDYAEALYNRGNVLKALQRLDEALASFHRALAIRPDYADAYINRGNTLQDLKRLEEALESYEAGMAIRPDCEFLLGIGLHIRMQLCDWRGFSEKRSELIEGLSRRKPVSPPFPVLALLDSPTLQLNAARIYTDAKCPASSSLESLAPRHSPEKIRIGYYSADFHRHATAHLMAELFEEHDVSRFEVFGFSFGPAKNDEMRQRLSGTFAQFFQVGGKSDLDVARISRAMGVDIAVDLKGHTKDSRPRIFAARAAPIQVSYLGYPGTMGATYIDYLIADRTLIPPERQSDYSEKVVYLPHSYQANDAMRRISDTKYAPGDFGLPDAGFVFCSFNNSYKILPGTFDVWMRILKAVEGSVLWLLEDNPTASANLRKEAENRGIDRNRLVFSRRLPLAEHLARHRLADLFIDTFPCNAHTTASDALWAGLPVLTCMGDSFASRVAASLLKAIELPELIAHSREEYEARAIELATEPGLLGAIKEKIQRNRQTTPLFNGRRFARHLETAYEAMYQRYQAGLPAAVIEINP